MSPITHFLASWSIGDVSRLRGRDQALVTWCGVLPDLDGLGVLVDWSNQVLGRPTSWYAEYHHALLHGLVGALLIPAALSLFAARRLRVFAVGFLAAHFHFLCDFVGSRGPDPGDVWSIRYLAPFSERLTFQWSGQWALNAWPNVAFTIALMAFAFERAIQGGYSPVGVFSASADRAFCATVRARWSSLRPASRRQP